MSIALEEKVLEFTRALSDEPGDPTADAAGIEDDDDELDEDLDEELEGLIGPEADSDDEDEAEDPNQGMN